MADGNVTTSALGTAGHEDLELILTLLPEDVREFLKCCAVLSAFDPQLIAEAVGEPVGDLDVAALPFVQKVPGREGSFRLEDDIRLGLLAAWWSGVPSAGVPPELARVSDRVAELLERRGADPAEILQALLFADPDEGLRRFEQLYADADAHFDLVRCRRLLELLEPMASVSAAVESKRDLHSARLDSRHLWIDDWYRTSTFLLPAASAAALDGLINGSPSRVLQIRGSGGFGKTMHVRWFVAHRCIPESIPCARVDFDMIDPYIAALEPHLVLLEMAAQLDIQVPNRAFGKLVRQYQGERRRLRSRDPGPPGQWLDGKTRAVEDERLGSSEDISARFLAGLEELPRDRPVVILLDTLEVPLHLEPTEHGSALQPLLELLGAALRRVAGARIVLSGRYRIKDEVPLRELLGDDCPALVLPTFTEAEARSYLVEHRRIADLALVAAAAAAAQGVPFSLALLADLIDDDPAITPARIVRYQGAEYAYLIERVVKRITEQPVRWLLRYAAIPRRFDEEFAHDVLWPWILKVRSGEVADDDPAEDNLEHGAEAIEVWAGGDDGTTFASAWEQVVRYVSGRSWIFRDSEDPAVLHLQPEVVGPMRRILSERPIVGRIHLDAAEYFEQRAEVTHSIRQRDLLQEATFHRFELGPEAAMDWWRAKVREADDDPSIRVALAEELVRADRDATFTGGDVTSPEPARPAPGPVQEARLELCLASAELATANELLPERLAVKDNDVLRARDALAGLERGGASDLPQGRLALARAAVSLACGRVAGEADMRAALTAAGATERERLWIAVAHARRLVEAGAPAAGDWLARASALARHAEGQLVLRRALSLTLIDYHVSGSRYGEAIAECDAAVRAGLATAEFGLMAAMLQIRSGDSAQAQRTAATVAIETPLLTAEARVVEAHAHAHRFRAEASVARASEALATVDESEASGATAWVRGHASLQMGRAFASVRNVDQARAALSRAIRTFEDFGDFEGVAACHNEEAALLLHGLGHLRGAGVALDHAERAAPEDGRAALEAVLLRAHLAHRLGDSPGADAVVRAARGRDPASRARIAMTGLVTGRRRDRDDYVELLAEALMAVTPPVARLELLAGVERCNFVLRPPSKHRKRLRSAIPSDGWDGWLEDLAPCDRGMLRLRAAGLAAMVGDTPGARKLLAVALDELEEATAPSLAFLEAQQIARAARLRDCAARAGARAVDLAQEHRDSTPLLISTAVVQHLEAEFDARAPAAADAELLMKTAGRLRAGGQSMAEAWEARLELLLADVERVDRVSRIGAAIRLYEAAGDTRAAERLQGGGSTHTGRRPGGAPQLAVELSFADGAIRANPSRPWYQRLQQTSDARAVRDSFAAWSSAAGAKPYPPELPDLMLVDLPAFGEELGKLVATPLTRRSSPDPRTVDLAIRIQDGALQPLPWELAADPSGAMVLAAAVRRLYRAPARTAPDPRVTRFLQQGLNRLSDSKLVVDGVFGPDTRKVLQTLQASLALPEPEARPETLQRLHDHLLAGAAPRVIIVRRRLEGRRREFALERRYTSVGLHTTLVDRSHAASLSELLRSDPPPVIVHVVGGLFTTGSATAIDLGDGSAGDDSGMLTSSDLDRALRAVPPNWPVPILLLDVPAPTGRREAAEQLLLRNALAGDVFALGGARVVIAAGLARADDEDVLEDVLVEGLAQGDAVGDIVQAVRQQAITDGELSFSRAIAFAATALWTDDPAIRLPPASRS